ncbi:hypothetical protein BpHYR1_025809 [Brachionus plicatilis]|uniref:Uncharacterized protein n=1 Tax=Brachionus plicatilis TaxID=10195 RepID=A0A3M7PP87_BRAPC|nr:hypothetical protein BpHYR1_025809 [Brachionus plicatilis]
MPWCANESSPRSDIQFLRLSRSVSVSPNCFLIISTARNLVYSEGVFHTDGGTIAHLLNAQFGSVFIQSSTHAPTVVSKYSSQREINVNIFSPESIRKMKILKSKLAKTFVTKRSFFLPYFQNDLLASSMSIGKRNPGELDQTDGQPITRFIDCKKMPEFCNIATIQELQAVQYTNRPRPTDCGFVGCRPQQLIGEINYYQK